MESDWRIYECYLNFISQSCLSMQSIFFKKSILPNLLKNVKKQNCHNRNLIIKILIKILTGNFNFNLKSDIHSFMNYEMVASRSSLDRSAYIYFCQEISTCISKKTFQDRLLENYLNLLEDKQISVTIAVLKTLKDIRMKMDDSVQILKLENFLGILKQDISKKSFIKEVAFNIAKCYFDIDGRISVE